MKFVKNTLFLILFLFLSACATHSVLISSSPEGANVYNANNHQFIGVTPLQLGKEQLEAITLDKFFFVKIEKPGFESRDILVKASGNDKIILNLKAESPETFKEKIIPQYSTYLSEVTRELLLIQGLILARRTEEASEKLKKFDTDYPNISTSFVLKASIARLNLKDEQALKYLERAQSIDPEDSEIKRMIQQIQANFKNKDIP